MKGSEKLLTVLNQLLADKLTAISQYIVHAEICDNWGYDKLHQVIGQQAHDEMHHARWLIQRIISLKGTPLVANVNPIQVGQTVLEMIGLDQEAELASANAYKAAIRLAHETNDRSTADLLTDILKMEEAHGDWTEKQRVRFEQRSLEDCLANQTHGAGG